MKNKPKQKDVKLAFNPAKHDAKIEKANLSDEQRKLLPSQKALKKRAHSIMQKFKTDLKSKPRTPQEVIAATYKLQTKIGELSHEAKRIGLDEWHNFTMQIIEDDIARLVSTGITAKNEIIMWVPEHPTMLDDDNDKIVREQLQRDVRPIQFRTLEELYAIPFVANARGKQGFVGLVLHGKGLLAVYNDGEAVGIGILANGVGVTKLPTLEDYSAALAATAAPDAGTATSPANPAAGSARSSDTTPPST